MQTHHQRLERGYGGILYLLVRRLPHRFHHPVHRRAPMRIPHARVCPRQEQRANGAGHVGGVQGGRVAGPHEEVEDEVQSRVAPVLATRIPVQARIGQQRVQHGLVRAARGVVEEGAAEGDAVGVSAPAALQQLAVGWGLGVGGGSGESVWV